jgi:hypothetical protein
MAKLCEVTWADETVQEYLVDPCPNDGEFVALSIGDNRRHVFVVCLQHAQLAEGMRHLWIVSPLPGNARIGIERE